VVQGFAVEDGQSCPSPERTLRGPAFAWIHGLTDRIVRPPHILRLTAAAPAITRALLGAPAKARVHQGWSCLWRTDNPVRHPERTLRGRDSRRRHVDLSPLPCFSIGSRSV
jgi:hypothetical protein